MSGVSPGVCFQVEKIIGVIALEGNVKNFKVQWAPTWVSSSNLVGCEKLIDEYLRENYQYTSAGNSISFPMNFSMESNLVQSSTPLKELCDIWEKNSSMVVDRNIIMDSKVVPISTPEKEMPDCLKEPTSVVSNIESKLPSTGIMTQNDPPNALNNILRDGALKSGDMESKMVPNTAPQKDVLENQASTVAGIESAQVQNVVLLQQPLNKEVVSPDKEVVSPYKEAISPNKEVVSPYMVLLQQPPNLVVEEVSIDVDLESNMAHQKTLPKDATIIDHGKQTLKGSEGNSTKRTKAQVSGHERYPFQKDFYRRDNVKLTESSMGTGHVDYPNCVNDTASNNIHATVGCHVEEMDFRKDIIESNDVGIDSFREANLSEKSPICRVPVNCNAVQQCNVIEVGQSNTCFVCGKDVFVCEICSKSFPNHLSVTYHKNRVHSVRKNKKLHFSKTKINKGFKKSRLVHVIDEMSQNVCENVTKGEEPCKRVTSDNNWSSSRCSERASNDESRIWKRRNRSFKFVSLQQSLKPSVQTRSTLCGVSNKTSTRSLWS